MWIFYMAMAINRLSYRFIGIHKEDLDSVAGEMFHLTNQAIHLFLSVIHDLESQLIRDHQKCLSTSGN
jgi:hypothetical protein